MGIPNPPKIKKKKYITNQHQTRTTQNVDSLEVLISNIMKHVFLIRSQRNQSPSDRRKDNIYQIFFLFFYKYLRFFLINQTD